MLGRAAALADRHLAMPLISPLASVRPAFRALAEVFVPEIVAASPSRWLALERTVGETLLSRPRLLRRQVVVLVRGLDLWCRLVHGRGLAGLDPARRTAFLRRREQSSVALIRRGVWGLRTLVMMGWYTQLDVAREIGYRASPAGWSARR
jgi:hypothetical protein